MAREFKINFDFTNALKDLKEINRLSADVNSNFFATEKSVTRLTAELEGALMPIQESILQLERQRVSLDKHSDKYKEINMLIDKQKVKESNLTFQLERTKLKLNEIAKERAGFQELIAAPSDAFADLVEEIPLAGKLLSPLFRHPLDNLNKLNKSFASFNNALENVKGIEGFGKQIGGVFQDFFTNIRGFSKNFV